MKTFLGLMRALGYCVLIAFLACALTPLSNAAARVLQAETEASAAGAIVVLGADLRGDGSLGDASLRRTITGIEQYHLGVAPLIVFMGTVQRGGTSEASVRHRLALQLGVPGAALLEDSQGKTTREEAQRAKVVLASQGIDSIVIISDGLHLRRAKRAFEREGFRVGTVAADSLALNVTAPEDRLRLVRSVAQQALALFVYQITE